jgi:hypothetical protein
MNLNRKHKAILFTTLVLTGSGLLAGAELKDALGMMMLGAALAWAVGSDVAASSYARLKGAGSTFYFWLRLPLAMTFAGSVLGAALLFSHANPVVAVAAMSVVGILIAPFTSIPSQNILLKAAYLVLAPVVFVFAALAVLIFDKSYEQDAGRFGQLTVIGLFALLVGIWWLSKGWRLILKGITVETATVSVSTEGASLKAFGQYVSLLLGVIVLILWVGLIAWSASGNWAYGPQENAVGSKADDNPIM